MTYEDIMRGVQNMKYTHFHDDEDKMRDFNSMGMDEFLRFYSYLTEEEYMLTLWEHQKRMPEIYNSERFYVDGERCAWLWYNVDSNCGDTIEEVCFDTNLIEEAMSVCDTAADVFEYILENGRQYGSDVGTVSYDVTRHTFEHDEPFAVGATEETFEKLKAHFNLKPQYFYCVQLLEDRNEHNALYYNFAHSPEEAAELGAQSARFLIDKNYTRPLGVYNAQYGVLGGGVSFEENLLEGAD